MAVRQQPQKPFFPHLRNLDGTFDSICPYCYRTISHEQSELHLEKSERAHRCSQEDARYIEEAAKERPVQ